MNRKIFPRRLKFAFVSDIANPSDEYTMQELKELFKSGEFLPFDPKDVEYEAGQISPYYESQPTDKERALPFNEPTTTFGDYPIPAPPRDLKRHLNTKSKLYFQEYESPSDQPGYSEEPEFYYNMKPQVGLEAAPFAVPPVDPRYYQQVPTATNKAGESNCFIYLQYPTTLFHSEFSLDL